MIIGQIQYSHRYSKQTGSKTKIMTDTLWEQEHRRSRYIPGKKVNTQVLSQHRVIKLRNIVPLSGQKLKLRMIS